MFNNIPNPQQAMLWLAIILSAGYVLMLAFGVVPLIRALRDTMSRLDQRLDVLAGRVARMEETERCQRNSEKNGNSEGDDS